MTIDEYVTANLAKAPPLSAEQRDALALLLAPVRIKLSKLHARRSRDGGGMIPEHRSAGSGDGRSANTAGDARCEARARRLEQRAELPRIAWSAAEFAEMVGLSADCVRELLRNGEIPATKFGQQWRIADSYVQQVRGGGPNRPVTA